MTTSYILPYDIQDLAMADNDYLLYDNSVDNILGLSNNATVDHMDDLLWNFDHANFAINDDDTDCRFFDTASYDLSTEVRSFTFSNFQISRDTNKEHRT
jgi:hypothetical protein